jgi:hypothetical protein
MQSDYNPKSKNTQHIYSKVEIITSKMMKGVQLVTVLVLALACSLASAYDPSPLQDFCVAINDSTSSYAGMK